MLVMGCFLKRNVLPLLCNFWRCSRGGTWAGGSLYAASDGDTPSTHPTTPTQEKTKRLARRWNRRPQRGHQQPKERRKRRRPTCQRRFVQFVKFRFGDGRRPRDARQGRPDRPPIEPRVRHGRRGRWNPKTNRSGLEASVDLHWRRWFVSFAFVCYRLT